MGRWWNVDPQIVSSSPYMAMGNTPMMAIDPDGENFWGALGSSLGRGLINWLFGVADNKLNKNMSWKDALANTSFSVDGTINSAGQFSNPQYDQYLAMKGTYAAAQSVEQQVAAMSGMGRPVQENMEGLGIQLQLTPLPVLSLPYKWSDEYYIYNGRGGRRENQVANSNSNEGVLGIVVSGIGVGGSEAGNIGGTFRIAKSGKFSPGYYSSGWKGNQYVRATYSVSKVGTRISNGAGIISTSMAYNEILNGNPQPITYADATVGSIGLTASTASYFSGAKYPGVGFFVAVYGAARLGWDVGWDLGVRYGPSTWFAPKPPESDLLEYFRQK